MSKARKDPERWWNFQGDNEYSSCISAGHGLLSQALNHLEGLDMSCTAMAQSKLMQFPVMLTHQILQGAVLSGGMGSNNKV